MAFSNNRKLLNGATATNGVPADNETVGIALPGGVFDRGTIAVASTAGSGTMTVTLKAWGYINALAAWVPLGTNATDASRGLLNEANAIGETATDTIVFAELIEGLATIDRFYLEVTAIAGTSTAIDAWLILRKR